MELIFMFSVITGELIILILAKLYERRKKEMKKETAVFENFDENGTGIFTDVKIQKKIKVKEEDAPLWKVLHKIENQNDFKQAVKKLSEENYNAFIYWK